MKKYIEKAIGYIGKRSDEFHKERAVRKLRHKKRLILYIENDIRLKEQEKLFLNQDLVKMQNL